MIFRFFPKILSKIINQLNVYLREPNIFTFLSNFFSTFKTLLGKINLSQNPNLFLSTIDLPIPTPKPDGIFITLIFKLLATSYI